MLIKPEPLAAAIRSAKEKLPNAKVVLMSPGGELFTQQKQNNLQEEEDLILIAGRYEEWIFVCVICSLMKKFL